MANRWVMLAIIFVTRIAMGFQFQSIASVGPLLVRDLALTYSELGWLIGLYMLPGALFALPGGMLGRRFGERRVVVASLAVMTLGGMITAQSASFVPAAAGRVFAGAGAVLMNILLAKMVADWFAGREISTAMAVTLTSWPVGLGLASTFVGGIATATSWRVAIQVSAGVAAVGLLLIAFVYRDPAGAASTTAGARAASGQMLAARVLAARVLAAPELSARDRKLSITGGIAWGCFNASLVTVLAFGPALLIARGATIADAGPAVSFAVWVSMVSVPLGGYLADRIRRPNLVIAGGSLVTAAVILLLPAMPFPALGFALVGLTLGPPPGAVMALLPNALGAADLTTAFGVYYTAYYLTMALAQPAAGLVRDVSGGPVGPIVFAAALMAATVLGLAIFRRIESGR